MRGRMADIEKNPRPGEITPAGIFVAVLSASNLTFAEVTWTQRLPDWIGSYCPRARPRSRPQPHLWHLSRGRAARPA